jgi:hypothetical protein
MRRVAITVAAMFCFSAPLSAQAQEPGANVPITAPLEQQYAGALTVLHAKVVALAQAIPAEKYAWRPAPEVRTVSQVLMHVAGEWFFLCPRSIGAQPPADFGAPGEKMRALELVVEKTEVLAQLEKSWKHCRSALDQIDPKKLVPDSLPAKMGFPRTVLLVSGDQHEHLGQLITYARSLGIVPPWSK